jgi:hypothetical protein
MEAGGKRYLSGRYKGRVLSAGYNRIISGLLSHSFEGL